MEENVKQNKYAPEVREKAVEIVKNGGSYSSAGKELGLVKCQALIRQWCMKAGVKSNFKAGRPKKLN